MKKKKPKYLISYLCWRCNSTSYLYDTEKPKCGDCGNEKNLLVVSKEKYGPKAINKGMAELVDKMIGILEKDKKDGYYWQGREDDLLKKIEIAKKLKEVLSQKKISIKERDKYLDSLGDEHQES